MQIQLFSGEPKQTGQIDYHRKLIDRQSWKPKDITADKVKTDFQTPAPVCDYMVDLIPIEAISILEPTPGIGNMVAALRAKGYQSITAPNDFFQIDRSKRFDCVVMNPPFSSRYAFNLPDDFEHHGMRLGYYMLTECMKMSDHVIALMPWFTVSDSDVRLRELRGFGVKSLTALPRKTFRYARIQTVVLELQKGYNGATEFKVFDF